MKDQMKIKIENMNTLDSEIIYADDVMINSCCPSELLFYKDCLVIRKLEPYEMFRVEYNGEWVTLEEYVNVI